MNFKKKDNSATTERVKEHMSKNWAMCKISRPIFFFFFFFYTYFALVKWGGSVEEEQQ